MLTVVKVSWDPVKSRANRKKHGVSFEEAQELFTSGIDYLEIFDDAHSDDEDRFLAISARWATSHEAQRFAKHMEQRS